MPIARSPPRWRWHLNLRVRIHVSWKRLEERLAASGISATPLHEMRRGDRPPRTARSGLTRWRITTVIAAAAFVAASVFAALLLNRAGRSNFELEQQIAAHEAQLREAQSQLQSSREQVDTLERVLRNRVRLEHILLETDLRLTRLEPLKLAPGSAGLVAVSSANGTALVQVSGLPPTPGGKTYELWWITRERGPVKAGLFEVQGPGTVIAAADPATGRPTRAAQRSYA